MFELNYVGKKTDGYPYDIETRMVFSEEVTSTEAIDSFLHLLEIATFSPEVINKGLKEIVEIRGIQEAIYTEKDKNC